MTATCCCASFSRSTTGAQTALGRFITMYGLPDDSSAGIDLEFEGDDIDTSPPKRSGFQPRNQLMPREIDHFGGGTAEETTSRHENPLAGGGGGDGGGQAAGGDPLLREKAEALLAQAQAKRAAAAAASSSSSSSSSASPAGGVEIGEYDDEEET